MVSKAIVNEVIVPKAPVKKVYRIKALTEKEKALLRLRSSCIKGEIESSEVWKDHRCGACVHCQMYRETRTTGAYNYINGKREELLNEQSEQCTKYGHERIYHWNKWPRAREEERFGIEKLWRRK